MGEECCKCFCESCCALCFGCCSSSNTNNDCTCCVQICCGTCINLSSCIGENCDITNCFLCDYISSTYHSVYNNTKYELPKNIILIKDDDIFKINSLCIIEVQNNEI
jgi:hypothetical protein